MAMIFFACWIVWAFQAIGVKGIFLDLFGPKGDTTGLLRILMIVVFFLVGFLEVLSILFRPISLSFRLYGNIFAGENMLEAMAQARARVWLAAAGAVLFHGTAGGDCAGAGVHAADGGVHDADLHARRRAGRGGALSLRISAA